MTVFKELKKLNSFKSVRRKNPDPLCHRPLKDNRLISKFIGYWEDAPRFSWPDQNWYTGTGLHYSELCDVRPIEQQICGNPNGRPDYQDTMLYDQEVVPGLLDGFGPFSTVRSKITQISNRSLDAAIAGQIGWHKDESPYEVLRVIVTLQSDLTYHFQIDNMSPVPLMPGHAYAFDQSKYHRVYSYEPSDLARVHLVLSFVTWFDKTSEGWKPNAFFGQRHPLDLFDLIDL